MSTDSQQHYKYIFGSFSLDTRRGSLEKNREEVKIRAQSFKVLAFLLSRSGTLVSKDELHQEIWGNKVVSDDSLTHCLLDIRKCIDDKDKDIIRTVPRRGYIFDAPCERVVLSDTDDELQSASVKSRKYVQLLVAGLSVLVALWLVQFTGNDRHAVSDNSLAVLPFADMSEAQDQRFLSNGMAEEVLNLLAKSPDLHVIARTSSFSFGDSPPDIAAIRELLNVAYVLEGSIHRREDRLTVTAQLIDTATSAIVWSDSSEGRPEDLVSLQKSIADAVLLQIDPDADGSVIAPAKRSFTADELMYLAKFYEQEVRERPEVDRKLLDEAISLYHRAILADPNSAIAYSRLAGAQLYAGDVRSAEAAIVKAYSLNPHISEVQETLGEYYWLSGKVGAGVAWQRAIELNPSNANALSAYAYWLWMQANDEGPEELFRRALELDPLSLARHAALGEFLGHQARVEKTRAVIERIKRRFNSPESYRVIARLLELTGQVDQSIAWTIRARDSDPGNEDHIGALAELYAEIGDFETAIRLEPEPGIGLLFKMRDYDALIRKAEIKMLEEPDDLYLLYLLAFAYNTTGQPELAIKILENAGQPLVQRSEIRQAVEIEGFVTYFDALDASGDSVQARELADWFNSKPHTSNDNWWIHVYRACTLAILNRDEEALSELELTEVSPRLPWSSTLRDSRCFSRYKDEPRYRAVLKSVQDRRAGLHQRLPKTLETFGVEL